MKTKCDFCGNSSLTEKRVQYIYHKKEQLLVVDDVPCEECTFCGERYYNAETLKKIENSFLQIHEQGRKTQHEIKVPVETYLEIV